MGSLWIQAKLEKLKLQCVVHVTTLTSLIWCVFASINMPLFSPDHECKRNTILCSKCIVDKKKYHWTQSAICKQGTLSHQSGCGEVLCNSVKDTGIMVIVLGPGTWDPGWLELLHCVLPGQDTLLSVPLPTNGWGSNEYWL